MEINEVIAALKERGHHFGVTAQSPSGMLLNIDGRLTTFDEAEQLLAEELELEKRQLNQEPRRPNRTVSI
jgi:hypothetical protein